MKEDSTDGKMLEAAGDGRLPPQAALSNASGSLLAYPKQNFRMPRVASWPTHSSTVECLEKASCPSTSSIFECPRRLLASPQTRFCLIKIIFLTGNPCSVPSAMIFMILHQRSLPARSSERKDVVSDYASEVLLEAMKKFWSEKTKSRCVASAARTAAGGNGQERWKHHRKRRRRLRRKQQRRILAMLRKLRRRRQRRRRRHLHIRCRCQRCSRC